MKIIDCSPRAVIGPSEQFEIHRYANGNTLDIVETILYADTRSSSFVLPGIACLEGNTTRETLRNVWGFVKENVKYRPDRPGHERVKSPGALFASGVGDCKSFSLAIGAMLRSLGIPYKYRFTAYEPGDVTHVYVVAETSGGPVILDAVHKKFDEEVPYHHKRDIKPNQAPGVHGIGEVSFSFSPWWLVAFALLLLNWKRNA